RLLVPVEVVGGDPVLPPERPAAVPVPERAPASVQSFPVPAPALAPSRPRRFQAGVVVAAALVGLAAGGAVARALLRAPTPVVPTFQRVTFGRGYVDSARFGPEGQIIYTAAWEGRPVEGFVVRAASLDARPVPDLGAHLLAVTRPGDLIFSD